MSLGIQTLGVGSRLTLLLWEQQGHGYQLTGQLVRSQEVAVLDGLAEIEQHVHFPQVERYLLVQVDSVEEFRFRVGGARLESRLQADKTG